MFCGVRKAEQVEHDKNWKTGSKRLAEVHKADLGNGAQQGAHPPLNVSAGVGPDGGRHKFAVQSGGTELCMSFTIHREHLLAEGVEYERCRRACRKFVLVEQNSSNVLIPSDPPLMTVFPWRFRAAA